MVSAIIIQLLAVLGLASAASRPNVIVVVADDLGWDDVSFHGSKQIPTPNIDSLAYDGIIMNNYYVQPICTPTRGALLTGRHPIHTGLQHSVIVGAQPYGLPLNETTMPQYFKQMDYATHIVGKWHLGFHAKEFTPTYRGFDSHFGYYLGMGSYYDHTHRRGNFWHLGFFAKEYTPTYRGFENFYGYLTGKMSYWDHTDNEFRADKEWGFDFRKNTDLKKDTFGEYSTELFSNEADRIIKTHDQSKPLFMYLPHQAVHSGNAITPLEAPWKYRQKFDYIKDTNRSMFAAMTSALDDAVGNLTRSLHEAKMLDNSIIVFTTDNGGPAAGFDFNHASNWPLRGLKSYLWEGGVRGTSFIWSPLLKRSGYVSNHMMHVCDWLPTLLGAAGYDKLPKNLDGVNQWPSLSHNTPSPRTEILHNIDPLSAQNYRSVRVGDMKLMTGYKTGRFSWHNWYRPESVDADPDATNNPRFTEEAPEELFNGQVKPILQKYGRGFNAEKPVQVKCGPKPADAATNCNPLKAPCLYNITADPCEYNNLAPMMIGQVDALLHRLTQFNRTAVEPLHPPEDPKGFPSKHNFNWVPWIELDNTKRDTNF